MTSLAETTLLTVKHIRAQGSGLAKRQQWLCLQGSLATSRGLSLLGSWSCLCPLTHQDLPLLRGSQSVAGVFILCQGLSWTECV